MCTESAHGRMTHFSVLLVCEQKFRRLSWSICFNINLITFLFILFWVQSPMSRSLNWMIRYCRKQECDLHVIGHAVIVHFPAFCTVLSHMSTISKWWSNNSYPFSSSPHKIATIQDLIQICPKIIPCKLSF